MKRTLLLAALLVITRTASAQVDVSVVNIIPNSLSNETERDAEPSIAVDPANPRRIAISAFTPDPLGSGVAPVFVSTDGGATWDLRPMVTGGDVTMDISLRFGGLSGVLYGGAVTDRTHVLRKADVTSTAPATILESGWRDQPWVEATTLLSGTSPDRVYIAAGDGRVDQSLDAATAPPSAGFAAYDVRGGAGCRIGPSVRPAVHPSGRVYVAFLRWSVCTGDWPMGDVVVVRDDNWGAVAPQYRALMTGAVPGIAAATGQTFAFMDLLGSQRVGMSVAIAVDPTNRDVVYVAWGEGSPVQNLHLRRSVDGGETWSSDLRVIPSATNPALAVNSQGVVGFMYQRYSAVPSGRWATHFESSSSGFTTPGEDLVLADVPDRDGNGNSLGDYANLVAIGKHFYGTFSGNNFPDRADFPAGVTYLRNVNWTTQRLRNLTDTADVPTSIDVFFFRVRMLSPENDFYVRDWNDGSTGDDGAEPSTHPVFYRTGDVWNRRDPLPGPGGPNDPPASEDAGNGVGSVGDNWAMARIRRNAPAASGTTTVNAHFLVSEFGTGSSYSDNTTMNPNLTFGPDVAVTFGASDTGPLLTPPAAWHLGSVMSPHLCLAVEISAPNDLYVPPSLAGQWPGWGTGTDLRILADNNRAQRNLGLSTVPAGGEGIMDESFAVIHNAATFTRDMELAYRVGGQGKWTPAVRIDGKEVDLSANPASIVLRDMQPGENRSLAVELNVDAVDSGQQVEIDFVERLGNVAVNGFTIAAKGGAIEDVIRERLVLHRSVFTRLAALGVAGAAGEAEVVRGMVKNRIDPKDYVTFLRKHAERIDKLIRASELLGEAGGMFGIKEALEALAPALKGGDPGRVALAHSILLHRADAALTRARLEAGDPADVVLMVRWQRDLFRDRPPLAKLTCAADLVATSDRYLEAIGRKEITNAEYPLLLERSAPCLSAALGMKDVRAKLLGDPSLAARQKAHRGLLLALQDALSTMPPP